MHKPTRNNAGIAFDACQRLKDYGSIGTSVFFWANSTDACVFSQLIRIVQLPPVESNEIVKFSIGEESLLTDIGTRANSSVCLLMINVHFSGLGTVKIVYLPLGMFVPLTETRFISDERGGLISACLPNLAIRH